VPLPCAAAGHRTTARAPPYRPDTCQPGLACPQVPCSVQADCNELCMCSEECGQHDKCECGACTALNADATQDNEFRPILLIANRVGGLVPWNARAWPCWGDGSRCQAGLLGHAARLVCLATLHGQKTRSRTSAVLCCAVCVPPGRWCAVDKRRVRKAVRDLGRGLFQAFCGLH